MCVSLSLCVCVCVCRFVRTYVRIYVYICICLYVCTDKNKCIYFIKSIYNSKRKDCKLQLYRLKEAAVSNISLLSEYLFTTHSVNSRHSICVYIGGVCLTAVSIYYTCPSTLFVACISIGYVPPNKIP